MIAQVVSSGRISGYFFDPGTRMGNETGTRVPVPSLYYLGLQYRRDWKRKVASQPASALANDYVRDELFLDHGHPGTAKVMVLW